MKSKFSKEQIEFLTRIYEGLQGEDKKIMSSVIEKMKYFNTRYDKKKADSGAHTRELRKKDKLYARGKTRIQQYFDVSMKRVKKSLDNDNIQEARNKYLQVIEDAKLPKYELYFTNAVHKYLSENEVQKLQVQFISVKYY